MICTLLGKNCFRMVALLSASASDMVLLPWTAIVHNHYPATVEPRL